MERGWPPNVTSLPKELHSFFEKRAELSVEGDVLLWRGRIVVPRCLQATMLKLLQEGHPGTCALRELAKFNVWWPHFDADVEHHVASCSACQSKAARRNRKFRCFHGTFHQNRGHVSIWTLPDHLKDLCG